MPEGQPIEPDLAWVGVDDLPLEFANIFTALAGENALFLNIGSVTPPVIESEQQLAAFRFIPIKPIARIAMTPGNLDDLIATLENARRTYKEYKDQQDS